MHSYYCKELWVLLLPEKGAICAYYYYCIFTCIYVYAPQKYIKCPTCKDLYTNTDIHAKVTCILSKQETWLPNVYNATPNKMKVKTKSNYLLFHYFLKLIAVPNSTLTHYAIHILQKNLYTTYSLLMLGQHCFDSLHKCTLIIGNETNECSFLGTEQKKDDASFRCWLWWKVDAPSLNSSNNKDSYQQLHASTCAQT